MYKQSISICWNELICKLLIFIKLILNSYLKENFEYDEFERDEYNYDTDYGTHYGEYAGSYAQDIMGYSDDVINDAFDGDPDAYWNID